MIPFNLVAAEVTRLTSIADCGLRIADLGLECAPLARSAFAGDSAIRRFSGLAVGLLLFVAASASTSVFAQPVPKITSISPEWIQRGTTNDVTIVGENLAAVSGFIFSGDHGLSATNLPPPMAPQPAISIESSSGSIVRTEAAPPKDNKRLVVRLGATADAKLGAREFRVMAPGGVSEPLSINVGHLPEIAEREPNNTLEQAQVITFPATISGIVSGMAQIDYYKFKAAKGQDLIFDVDAFRRGSPLDSTLAVLDANGKELVRSEDVNGFDSLILFSVPTDGDYFLQIRDFRFQGSGAHKYRINAGPLPYLESIFPFGGQRGKQVEVALSGRNLEGTTKMTFAIAPNSPLGRQEIRANTPQGFSNPVPFDVQDTPDFQETEPNDTADKANVVSIPIVVNGKINAAKDVDRFKFKAPADQKIVCAAIASRYGSPLDPLLVLEDSKGSILQQNDDATGADARIEFDAKKDTEYVIALRDLTENGGDKFSYRLVIRPPSAAEATFVVRFSPDTVRINRGGTSKIRCEITRTGFDGPVRVAFEDLPPGVYGEPLVLTAAPGSGLILLSATASASLGTFPLKLTGIATIAGKTVARSAEALLNDKPVKESFLTVLDTAPFTLDLVTLSADIEQNRSASVEVMAQRREGFAGEIKLSAEGYSTGKDPITKSLNVAEMTLKPAESLGRVKFTARQDSEIGTRSVLIRGEANVDGQTIVQYSREVPVTITQIPFIISSTLPKLTVTAVPVGSQSAAGEASTTIKVERRDGFTNELDLTINGMPDGINATLEKIPANGAESTLKIVATDKAVPGTNYSFTVLGKSQHKDRNYKFKTGSVALVVNVPEPMERVPLVATNTTNTASAAVSPAAAK